jgi:hypothetical protein
MQVSSSAGRDVEDAGATGEAALPLAWGLATAAVAAAAVAVTDGEVAVVTCAAAG